jgi:hypothetical protein
MSGTPRADLAHMRALLLVAATAVLAGCGGSTGTSSSANDGGPDAVSPTDAGLDRSAPGDGGCITPVVGEACTSGEVACQPSDPCCAGYEWTCSSSSGTWQQAGLGCACQVDAGPHDAGPFACGSTTCAGDAYCEDHPPGIVGPDGSTLPDAFTCSSLPSSCASNPTCACIEATLPAQDVCSTKTPGVTCSDDGAGHVILHCLGV